MFNEVQIYPSVKQGTMLQWVLTPDANELPFASFVISVSRDGLSWDEIATVVDTYFYVDTETRATGVQQRLFYRVVLNGDWECVKPYDMGALSKKDQALIREMTRKELLSQRLGGRSGYLLKRRTLGGPCTRCLSDGGEPQDPHCPICYGTGFKGGYHVATKYGVTEHNPKIRITSKTSPMGTYKPEQTVVRGIAFPHLDNLDVWVDCLTDKRYYIKEVDAVSFKGIPIIYSDIKMVLAPAEDIIYKVVV